MEEDSKNGFRITDTILYWGLPDSFLEKLEELCSSLKVKLWIADSATDVLAVPSFLSIIDPQVAEADDLEMLSQVISEMDDPSCKILFTSDIDTAGFPPRNLVRRPSNLDDDFLKFLILKTRSKIRGMKARWERTEGRLVRLMHMVRLLDTGIPFSVAEISSEFLVTKRTIQRDIAVLEMAGYPIQRDDESKYSTPLGFKVFEFHYQGMSAPESERE